MARNTFTVELDDQASRRLRALGAAASDLTPLMRGIAGVIEDEAQQAFEDEASPDGEPWAPLTPGRIQARGGDAHPILQDRGDLARLITDYGSDYAQVGSNEPYAAIHQSGGTTGMPPGPAAIAARPYLGLSDAARAEIGDLAADYLEKALR